MKGWGKRWHTLLTFAAFDATLKELRGAAGHRLWVGNYRVLFTRHDGEPYVVFVYAVGHRREIYEH
jgi:mRNA-degrading endonuclease RelE of RelBE toxin-antitoxin system